MRHHDGMPEDLKEKIDQFLMKRSIFEEFDEFNLIPHIEECVVDIVKNHKGVESFGATAYIEKDENGIDQVIVKISWGFTDDAIDDPARTTIVRSSSWSLR